MSNADPKSVPCPSCGARVGSWCKRPSGHSGPMVAFHAARRKAAESAVTEPLTPEHPRWREFTNRLAGPEGCHFRDDENGRGIWNCGNDHRFSRAILTAMGVVNVEGTLGFFRCHGGYCDCEVLFNVDRGDGDEEE